MIKDLVKDIVKDLVVDNVVGTFDPITLSPLVWFDSSDASTIALSGDNVTQWRDKSSNNKQLTQPEPTEQPSFFGNGVIFNSDHIDALDILNDGPQTVFVVYKVNVQTGLILSGEGNGPNKSRFYFFTDKVDFGNTELSHTNTDLDTVLLVSAWVNDVGDGSTQNVQVNNGTVFSGSVDRGVTPPDFSIGARLTGSTAMDGTVYEVLIFDTELDATNRGLVQNYLQIKWGT